MRSIWRLSCVLACIFIFSAGSIMPASASNTDGQPPGTDRILVRFKAGVTANTMAEVHRKAGARFEGIIPGLGVQIVTVPRSETAGCLAEFRSQEEVAFAEPDHLAAEVEWPNDPYFSYQWGMTKVQAPAAWDVTRGSPNVRIAVLDTGIDVTHPDLAGKVVSSVNFTDSPTAYANGHHHGTLVAGVTAALTSNGIGVSGLGRNSSLMNVKVLGDSGYGYYSWIANGVVWAADNGANVINLSLGASAYSSTLENAVNYAWGKGVVVVAASGNDGTSNAFYPAYFSNAIAVAATDSNNYLASFSNYGWWVDVAAPGVSILTTTPGGYAYASGTSLASPHVAGLAGLVFTVTTDTNGDGRANDEVRARIENSCTPLSWGVTHGLINAYESVRPLSPLPGRITGTVTSAATGTPIAGATVTDGSRSASTGVSGIYSIEDVPPGAYIVTASANGFSSMWKTTTVVSGKDTALSFQLTPVNHAPVLDPVGNKAVKEGQLLEFVVSAADADGDSLTYSASGLPAGAEFDAASRAFSWTPTFRQAGIYPGVSFRVTDGKASDSEAITVTVSNVATTGWLEGTVSNSVTDSPVSGANVTAGSEWDVTDSSGYYGMGLPEGTYTVTASAEGFESASKGATVGPEEHVALDFQLTPVNRAPVLDPVGSKTVKEGQLLEFKVSATDADGNSLTYSAANLPQGASFDSASRVFSWTPGYTQAGLYSGVTFTVSDGKASDSETITIAVANVITTGWIEGTVSNSATGAPISSATVTNGSASAATDGSGYYQIPDVLEGFYTVTASAPGFISSSRMTNVGPEAHAALDFQLVPVNHAPVLDSIGDRAVNEGQLLRFSVSATDADGDVLTFLASGLPAGASFDAAARTFSWTPTFSQAGTYAVTFSVTDGESSDSEAITITVNNVVLTGTVAGRVLNAVTGAPVSGAVVSDGTRSATTDGTGSYFIPNVPEGVYTLTASAAGYRSSSTAGVPVYAGQQRNVSFFLNPEKAMWVGAIEFNPYGRHLGITARVLDPAPVDNVSVNVDIYRNNVLIARLSNVTKFGEASFALQHAPAGTYRVTVTSLSHLSNSLYVWTTSSGVTSGTYLLG